MMDEMEEKVRIKCKNSNKSDDSKNKWGNDVQSNEEQSHMQWRVGKDGIEMQLWT